MHANTRHNLRLLAVAAIAGALIGLWLGPGRAYSAEVRSPDSSIVTLLNETMGRAVGITVGAAEHAAYRAKPVLYVGRAAPQPYGGCKEAANYPWTEGWRWCVRNDRLEVRYPRCKQEDGPGPCVWDARHRGNGLGRSFYLRRNGTVLYIGHRLAHELTHRDSR